MTRKEASKFISLLVDSILVGGDSELEDESIGIETDINEDGFVLRVRIQKLD